MHLEDTKAGQYTHEVSTRWYRAPELLFGSRRYGAAVDLWAVGCVIAQMLRLDPILPGESDIDQIFVVATLLGTPTEACWPGVSAMPDYGKIEIPDLEPAMQMHLHWDLDFQDAETRSSFVHFTVHGLHAPSLVE